MYADNILPVSHPDHKRVYEITNKLIMANTDEITGQHMNWEVNVVESNEINAFVLPVSCRMTVFIIRKVLPVLHEARCSFLLSSSSQHTRCPTGKTPPPPYSSPFPQIVIIAHQQE